MARRVGVGLRKHGGVCRRPYRPVVILRQQPLVSFPDRPAIFQRWYCLPSNQLHLTGIELHIDAAGSLTCPCSAILQIFSVWYMTWYQTPKCT